ncbi:hypothetical protein [Aliiruegeria sabulilitoris]|uniref:hypothetical protein n=1 Tax=Aliiruegeria sabulilitoris TaxID=1510458 RepID=UPI00083007EA|nr:hypothetical protein [Aliiruegeria sabulilitoris]NDR57924.1 hypothetical protein [Pseudoruegeria sp. M32A2M]
MLRTFALAAFLVGATSAFADSHNAALIDEITSYLDKKGIEYTQEEVDALTDEQLASVKNVMSSGGDTLDNQQKAAIRAILTSK